MVYPQIMNYIMSTMSISRSEISVICIGKNRKCGIQLIQLRLSYKVKTTKPRTSSSISLLGILSVVYMTPLCRSATKRGIVLMY